MLGENMKTQREIRQFLSNTLNLSLKGINLFMDWYTNEFTPGEIYYKNYEGGYEWIVQFKYLDKKTKLGNDLKYTFMYCIHTDKVLKNDSCDSKGFVLATPEQRDLLIQKVRQFNKGEVILNK